MEWIDSHDIIEEKLLLKLVEIINLIIGAREEIIAKFFENKKFYEFILKFLPTSASDSLEQLENRSKNYYKIQRICSDIFFLLFRFEKVEKKFNLDQKQAKIHIFNELKQIFNKIDFQNQEKINLYYLNNLIRSLNSILSFSDKENLEHCKEVDFINLFEIYQTLFQEKITNKIEKKEENLLNGIRGNFLILFNFLFEKIKFTKENFTFLLGNFKKMLENSEITEKQYSEVRVEFLLSSDSILEYFPCHTEKALKKTIFFANFINFLNLFENFMLKNEKNQEKFEFPEPFLFEIEKIFLKNIENLKTIQFQLENDKKIFSNQFKNEFLVNFHIWKFLLFFFIEKTRKKQSKIADERAETGAEYFLNYKKFYKFSILISSVLPSGTQYLLVQLFYEVLFNKNFLQNLFLETSGNLDGNLTEIQQKKVNLIVSLRDSFQVLFPAESLNFSKNLLNFSHLSSTFVDFHRSFLPLQFFWFLFPISACFPAPSRPGDNQAAAPERLNAEEIQSLLLSSFSFLSSILSSFSSASDGSFLTGLFLFVLFFSKGLNNSTAAEERGFIFCEVAKCFLIDDEIYKEELIYSTLRAVLLELLPPGGSNRLVFSKKQQSGIKDIVTEYISTSFGDPLFTDFILFYFQMHHSPDLHSFLWNEIAPVAHLLKPSFYPFKFDDFIAPVQQNEKILQSMANILGQRKVNRETNEFLHKICLHHLAANLFSTELDFTPSLSSWHLKNILTSLPQVSFSLFFYFLS